MSYLADYVKNIIRGQSKAYADLFNRVVSDFDALETRAEQVSQNEWNRLISQPVVDSSEGDMGAFAERAEQHGQEYYEQMFPLAQTLLNLFTLGLFHLFEQQLFLVHRLHNGDQHRPKSMEKIFAWINDDFEFDPNEYPMTPRLKELNLVANVIKHAEGESAKKLREVRAQLFQHPAERRLVPANFPPSIVWQPLTGESIYILRNDFEDYASQVDGFWTKLGIDLQARNR